MRLADLKQGMVCELRNGDDIIVIKFNKYIKYDNSVGDLEAYNDDLKHNAKDIFDIIKVKYGDKVLFEREEKVKWFEPKENEFYYYVSPLGRIIVLNNERDEDKEIIAFSQVFKTYEEAEQHLEYKQAELKIIKFIAQNDNVVLDWENEEQKKYNIYYLNTDKTFNINFNQVIHHLPKQFYLSSKELAQRLIDELGTELKIWLGVRE